MIKRKDRKKRALIDTRFVPEERRRNRNWLLILLGSIVMTVFVQRHVISLGIVTDVSMMYTLKQGEVYLVNKYLYTFKKPQRGEIVVLLPYKYANDQYVKRVIGLEGETVLIKGGKVFVNGIELMEPYVFGETGPDAGPMMIPAGTYFVMGDNRVNSYDSRQFGAVPQENIGGKIKPGVLFCFS